MNREMKMRELVRAKDYLDRSIAILRVAGYSEYNDIYRGMVNAERKLRCDITALQMPVRMQCRQN